MAEVAFSVAKGWQGKGLSKAIMKKLAAAAKDNGISGLVAFTSLSNRAMISVFNGLPYKVVMNYEDDLIQMKCRFDDLK
jgi:GNAT superfamily N-acetyltransferase